LSRKNLILVAIAVVLLMVGAGAAWYFLRPASEQTADTAATNTASAIVGAPGQPGDLPDPIIAVLDRAAILQYSKVGQDIMRQMQVFTKQASDRIQGQRRSLENDIKQFQEQEATMAADARQKRAEALQQRQNNLQNAAAREENTLKSAMAVAHNEVAKQMEPILQQIVSQRSVNMVLDKSAVPVATGPEFDITPDVIAALDARMTSYPVSLTAKPAGATP
jgi:Skp family chaperone for outer membrane proteins